MSNGLLSSVLLYLWEKYIYLETKMNASVASTRVQKAFSMNFREQKRLNDRLHTLSTNY